MYLVDEIGYKIFMKDIKYQNFSLIKFIGYV